MDFAALTNTVLDFIRQHPNWAAVFVFALAFGEFFAARVAGAALLGRAGWRGCGHSGGRPADFLDDCGCRRDWCRHGRLAVVLDWIPLSRSAAADVAAEQVPQAIGQRPVVLQALGCAGHCHIPFFRTAARQCAHRGRYRGNGMATFSIGQLELGFPMGFCFAVTRGMGPQMVDPTHWVITSTWRASSTFPLQP